MVIRIVLIALVLGFTDLAMATDEAMPSELAKYGALGLAIGVDRFSRFDVVDLDGSNRIKLAATEGMGSDLAFGYGWHRNASVEA